MKVIGVIPARYASTRLPGKPLAKILEKTLVERVLLGSSESQKISQLIVATDDERISSEVQRLGFEAVMTSPELPSGSDRVWKAIEDKEADVVVNIQGDEPLITGEILDKLVEPFEKDDSLEMATLGRVMDQESLESSNTAKIVVNAEGEALYFSRFPIPYSREKASGPEFDGCFKHIGLYAYRKPFLQKFCQQAPIELEKREGLEQLRALYLGAKIKVVIVNHDSWGVDTPEDIKKVEDILKNRN